MIVVVAVNVTRSPWRCETHWDIEAGRRGDVRPNNTISSVSIPTRVHVGDLIRSHFRLCCFFRATKKRGETCLPELLPRGRSNQCPSCLCFPCRSGSSYATRSGGRRRVFLLRSGPCWTKSDQLAGRRGGCAHSSLLVSCVHLYFISAELF